MRTLSFGILVLATFALAPWPGGLAETPSSQHVEDVILVGAPAGFPTRNAYSVLGIDYMNGIDAYIIHLNPGVTNFRVVGNEDPVGGCDIDVFFYDANRGSEAWTNNAICTEEGAIPAEATTIVIQLSVGVSVGFTFDAWYEAPAPS